MRTATIKIQGTSPYSGSRNHRTPMLDSETKDSAGRNAYEERTWREKLHTDSDGSVFIPPMAFKRAMDEQSKKLGKIPGQGMATWTKPFTQGTMIVEQVYIGKNKSESEPEWIDAHADGKRSCGTRVPRCFPVFREWSASVKVVVLDDIIKDDILRKVWDMIGAFNGVGRFRPANGGYFGRFVVEDIKWRDE